MLIICLAYLFEMSLSLMNWLLLFFLLKSIGNVSFVAVYAMLRLIGQRLLPSRWPGHWAWMQSDAVNTLLSSALVEESILTCECSYSNSMYIAANIAHVLRSKMMRPLLLLIWCSDENITVINLLYLSKTNWVFAFNF